MESLPTILITLAVIAVAVFFIARRKPADSDVLDSNMVHHVSGRVVATHVFQHMDSRVVSNGAVAGVAPKDEDFDVNVSVEYTDPWTGKTAHSHEKTTMSEALKRLPRDSFVISNSYATESGSVMNIDGVTRSFNGALELKAEAERLRAAGASEAEITAQTKAHREAIHDGFMWLPAPVPVNVIIDESEKGEHNVEFEWIN